MKLVTFRDDLDQGERLGVLVDDEARILDVQAAFQRRTGAGHGDLASMQALIEAGPEALDRVRALADRPDEASCVALRETGQLLAPLPRPIQLRDCLCFEEHLINAIDGRNRVMGRTERTPEQERRLELFRSRPFWYKANRMAFTGPDTIVHWPAFSSWMDYELEYAAVIGRTGRAIAEADAMDYVFGYTIFNDFSARDVQNDEMASLGPCRSKDFDNANVLGPCIVTADAFDLAGARMEARVNGERWGGGSTASMTTSFAQLIAFISTSETLHAGELLGSGTVGTGCGLELGRRLQSGDVVELEVEGIGILRNQVVAG
jgi:2-keto-4-pentenoate hydratase/2-oxohepta-3-ene-1,7-dioic acid hydratase in catechol pathway